MELGGKLGNVLWAHIAAHEQRLREGSALVILIPCFDAIEPIPPSIAIYKGEPMTTPRSTTAQTEPTKPAITTILRTGAIGIVIATLINAVLYLIGSTFTFPPDAITPVGEPVTIVPVAMITAVAGAVATVGYLVLTRFLSPRWTNLVMWLTAAAVLIGMFFSPFSIENAPVAEIVILEIMHVVTIVPVYLLTRLY